MSGTSLVSVDFNPQDAVPELLGLIVPASTGVLYGNQCGGLATLYKEREGYLVVVGRAEPFVDFFDRFDGHPPVRPTDWSVDDLRQLGDLVRDRAFYFVAAGHADRRILLTLDEANLTDLTEGWIPVQADEKPAILVFANSD